MQLLYVLNSLQHGFRQKHSSTFNLLEIINDITQDIDNRNNVDLITIDFLKTFNSISHSKLIHKLLGFGIRG